MKGTAAYAHHSGGGLLDWIARSVVWHAISRLVWSIPGGWVALLAVVALVVLMRHHRRSVQNRADRAALRRAAGRWRRQ